MEITSEAKLNMFDRIIEANLEQCKTLGRNANNIKQRWMGAPRRIRAVTWLPALLTPADQLKQDLRIPLEGR